MRHDQCPWIEEKINLCIDELPFLSYPEGDGCVCMMDGQSGICMRSSGVVVGTQWVM